MSEKFDNITVFCGDSSNRKMLIEEHIDKTDVFAIITYDKANIMIALLAKRMGAKKAMVLIQREVYVDIVQEANIQALLTHIRQGDICDVYSLRRGVVEAIEAIAHGDVKTSKIVGKKIGEIKMLPSTTIGAIVRDEEVLMGHDNIIISILLPGE